MEKVVFRNKFRVLDSDCNIVRLNTNTDRNGVAKYIEGFETQGDAIAALNLYCIAGGLDVGTFTVESYPESQSFIVPITKNEQVNKGLAKLKVFNGKGLKFNTDYHTRKNDNKYKPDKYYGPDVRMAQSVEHNKGISLISKKGDSRKFKNAGVEDIETAQKVERLKGARYTVQPSFIDHLVESLSRQNFSSAQNLKQHLRDKGFSTRQTNEIFLKVYKLTHA